MGQQKQRINFVVLCDMQSSAQVPSQEMNVCLNLRYTGDLRIGSNYKLGGLNITCYSERWPRDTVSETARVRHMPKIAICIAGASDHTIKFPGKCNPA